MNLEHGIELLKKERYQEAYDYFISITKVRKNINAQFYSSYIDYYYFGNKSIQEYNLMFQKLLVMKPPYLYTVIITLASISLDSNNLEDIKKYALRGHNLKIDHPIIHYSYAVICDDNKEKLIYLEKIIDNNEINGFILNNAVAMKLDVIRAEQGIDKVKEYINKLLIIHEDKQYVHYLNMVNEMITGDNTECVEQIAEMVLNNDEEINGCYVDTVYKLIDYYIYQKPNLERAIYYHQKINAISPNKNKANIELAMTYCEFGKTTVAIELLEQVSQLDEFDKEVYENLGDIYLRHPDKKERPRAIDCYQKILGQERDFRIIRKIGYAFVSLQLFSELDTLIENLKQAKNKKESDYQYYLKSLSFLAKGDFDKALKNGKIAFKRKVSSYPSLIDLLIRSEKSIIKAKALLNKHPRSYHDYFLFRETAKYFFHGDLLHQVSEKLAHEEILKALEIKANSSCVLSMYGNIMLDVDPKTAFTVFEKGSLLYYDGSETCTCCIGFLAKCYYQGLGVDENKAKAVQIIDDAFEKEQYNCSENIVHMYAFFRLLQEESLKKAYDILTSYYERRYSYTRYYLMSLLEKKIFGRVKKETIKKMAISFANAPTREKKYYKNQSEELVFPYMTNN